MTDSFVIIFELISAIGKFPPLLQSFFREIGGGTKQASMGSVLQGELASIEKQCRLHWYKTITSDINGSCNRAITAFGTPS